MNPATPVLAIEGLRFAWDRHTEALLEIDRLDLSAGEHLFVSGPSGSGKSTLLSLMAGVMLPNEGSIRLMGQPWNRIGTLARDRYRADHVGYIFQQFNLLGWLPVIDNVLLPCQFSTRRRQRAQASDGSARACAERWLDALELPASLWSRPAATLSVGQQQRVAAARAFIGAPELLIADEPTSALDAALRDRFVEALLAASAACGSALVLVSHDGALAAPFARRLSIGKPPANARGLA